jgi:hypothetical protein
MKLRTTSHPKVFRTAALLLVLGVSWIPASQAEGTSDRSPGPIADRQFQKLVKEVDRALASRDANALMQSGDAVRAYRTSFSPKPAEAKASRSQKLDLWLLAMSHVRSQFDPSFRVNDRPALNLVPMMRNGAGWNSGVAPEEIKDTKVREDYETRIAENSRKVSEYSWQLALRKAFSSWADDARSHVAAHYSSDPADVREVDGLLEQRFALGRERTLLRAYFLEKPVPPAMLALE